MRAYLLSRLRLQRKAFLATGLAVGLAVAFVVVVLGATSTLQQFLSDGAAPRARAATLVATPDTSAQDVRLPTAAQVAAVRALPGVAGVTAVRQAPLSLAWPDGSASTVVESLPGPGLAWYDVTAGRTPAAAGEVLVDARNARKAGLAPGDRLPVAVGPGASATAPRTLLVTGLFTARGPQPFTRTVLAREGDLAAWAGDTGGTDAAAAGSGSTIVEVDVLARPGADVAALRTAVRTALPGQQVRPAAEEVARAAREQTQGVDVLGRLVLGFTAVALLVAMIVIANTFAILLAQRTRELALLRCVGATRRQLRRATVAEAGALGVLASAAGVAAGAVVLVAAAAVAPRFADVLTGVRPVLHLGTLVGPFVVGVLVTLLSALAPARRATKVAPLAAMRPETAARARRTSRLRVAAAVVAGLLGGGALAAALSVGGEGSDTGVLVGMAGGTLVVLAVVLAGPVLVPALTRLLGAPLAAAGPVARIAVGNTRRNAARSASTSTALFVGVCLISVLTVGAATTVRAVEQRLDRGTPLDVALVTDAETLADPGPGLPAGAVAAVAKASGIVAAVGLRGTKVAVRPAAAPAAPAADGADAPSLGVLAGDPATAERVFRADLPLADGALLVPADHLTFGMLPPDVRDGSRVVVQGRAASVTLTVHVVRHLPQMVVTPATLDRLGAGPQVLALWARAADGADPVRVSSAVEAAIRSAGLAAAPGAGTATGAVTVADYRDAGSLGERATVVQAMDVLLAVSTALLAVALLISLVGIANTLSLSVLERSRESAVSRAVGMTRRQLRWGIAVEALVLGTVGCVLGLVVGGLLGWAGAATLVRGMADVSGPVVPPGRTAALVAVALGAALLASVLPGRRAARVSPTQALAEA